MTVELAKALERIEFLEFENKGLKNKLDTKTDNVKAILKLQKSLIAGKNDEIALLEEQLYNK